MLPVVGGAAALSLGAGLLVGPPAFAAETAPAPKPDAAASPTAEQKALDSARTQARSSGKRVLVEALTTSSSQTFANPSGTFTTDTSPAPARVEDADGDWHPLDATLRANSDGTLSPAFALSPLSLSGGGSGPMATMTTADGKKLAVKAPFPLPKPTLNGDDALYRDVLPDVDLRLTANQLGGWSQVLVVRTARAAANPALRKIRLDVDAPGLNVSADTAGNLDVKDGKGKLRFSSPTSLMWDSATAAPAFSQAARTTAVPLSQGPVPAPERPAASSADAPGAGATVKPIGTRVDAQGIELAPDTSVLGQGTGPWYIDPGINPTADSGTQAWSQVQEAYPDTNEYNATADGQDKPAAGYCGFSTCTRKGRERAYFRVGINTAIHGAEVIDARLNATVVSSSSPNSPTPMGLYWAGAISNPTSWNRQPCDKNSRMGGCTKIGGINISGTGDIQYDVTTQMKAAASERWSDFTFGFAPDNENDMYQRQRFGNSPHVVVEYDVRPTIWWPRTRPTPGFSNTGAYADCRTPNTANAWDNPGWVGTNSNITLTSAVYSATGRQLQTTFQYWDDDNAGKTEWVKSGWTGSFGDVSVDIGKLTDGHQYGWQSSTTDETLTSTISDMCFFRVDRTPPTAAVSSTDFPASGTIGAHPKRVGEEGTFTLTGTDPAPVAGGRTSGLACARWTSDPVAAASTSWKCTDTNAGVVPLTAGSATVKYTPTRWGTNFLYLQTQDVAGNLSQPVAYSYYTPSNPNSPAPVFGDVNGDAKADILLPDSAGSLRQFNGGTDPAGAPNARTRPSPSGTGWNGIQISHRGSAGYKNVDDLFAHQPGQPNLYVYTNDNTGLLDGQAPVKVNKPTGCVTADFNAIGCAANGYGANWTGVSQIAAFGSVFGETAKGGALGRTSLLFVENGRLWLSLAGTTNQLDSQSVLLSANDTRWDGYELITPGRAQGTDFPTLWARSKTDGSLHAFSVTGTADAPVLTGFTNPASGALAGTVDPVRYPRVGSDGDLTGDGIPDLWAVDSTQQLVSFTGTGTAPNGTTVAHPTATGIDPTIVLLGNLNTPTAQWKLTGQSGTTTPSAVGAFPATTAGITFPTASVNGVSTPYAAFNGTGSTITTGAPVVDTRKSFTLSTMAKVTSTSAIVLSQDGTTSSSFMVYADPATKEWRFALAKGDTAGWNFDWSDAAQNETSRIVFGAWTRLTAVYNADTGLMSLYVNGTLAGTGHHQASSSPVPSGPLVLGRYKISGQPDLFGGFTGGVSNLAVYPYAAAPTTPGALSKITLTDAGTHCVDNNTGSTADGNKIQIWNCNEQGGGQAQKFEIRADGTLRIQGKCLDATNAGTTNGTLIQLMVCHGHAAQQFIPRANNSVYNPVSGRCLDLDHMNTTDGTQLQLWDCNGSNPQRWTIPSLATAPLPIPVL
ncbi:ricin-type beta-trefoil lectin domain protein [Streptomyces sp. NPDC002138]|uniref:ricin-type beta-trefoil lectin domain protein n=1 Tax=Streptomyces sp. NPDC002138 TaxID=3154410 RepID=UPI003329F652